MKGGRNTGILPYESVMVSGVEPWLSCGYVRRHARWIGFLVFRKVRMDEELRKNLAKRDTRELIDILTIKTNEYTEDDAVYEDSGADEGIYDD